MHTSNKVAVLGAGTMGPGIATTYALHGYKTSVYSRTQETLGRAKAVVQSNLRLFLEENIIDENTAQQALSNLEFTQILEQAVEGAWYIAETIVEKPEAKTALYQQLDTLLPENTVIASNTSYLNIFELMPPRRLPYTVIAHWYTPAHILPLVEIVKGPKTLPEVMDTVSQFHSRCGKTPVQMEKFIPGFIVNRMQSAMNREVIHLIEEGYCTAENLDLAVKTSLMPRGLILGLVQRLDFNGIDMLVNSLNNKKYEPAPEMPHPAIVFDHYDKGEYGIKSGKGFYDYSSRPYEQVLRERDRLLLKSVVLADHGIRHPLHDKKG